MVVAGCGADGGKGTLIHWPVDRLRPTGGPAGYLNNLKQGLDAIGGGGCSFLPPAGKAREENRVLRKIVPGRIKDLRRLRRFLAMTESHLDAPVRYKDYRNVHFHSTEDLFLHRRALEGYRGRVILTSHSPCAYHRELIARLNPKDAERHAKELGGLEEIDRFAFDRADCVVFPCREAEEPYYHTWAAYESIRDEKKLHYVPTGISPCRAPLSREVVRARYRVPENAFVLSYVGRHNQIKGYGDLREAAPALLDSFEDLWFLNAGKTGPIEGLDHPRWVEAGWTDDPHSVIAAADAFLLPNRETYFDLVLLEVMSLGQIALVSNTGGNRYFEKLGSSGIRLFSTMDEMGALVCELRGKTNQERANWGEENKTLFEEFFSCRSFAESYVGMLDSLED